MNKSDRWLDEVDKIESRVRVLDKRIASYPKVSSFRGSGSLGSFSKGPEFSKSEDVFGGFIADMERAGDDELQEKKVVEHYLRRLIFGSYGYHTKEAAAKRLSSVWNRHLKSRGIETEFEIKVGGD